MQHNDKDMEKIVTPSKWGAKTSYPRHTERNPYTSPEIPKLVDGPLPSKLFYSLSEAAGIVSCKEVDLLHYAGLGKLRLHTTVPQHIALHAGDSWTGYWGQRDFIVELLELTSQICRKIEMHGSAWEDRFLDGWRIDETGHAVVRRPVHQDVGAGRFGGVWGCFTESGLSSIQIGPADVFVMSFDLDAFLKGTYQSSKPPNVDQVQDSSAAGDSDQREPGQPREEALLRLGHEHISDELRLINQAAYKFWGPSIDPLDKTTYPKNPTVSAWLQEQSEMSADHAKAAASIIRLHFFKHKKRSKIRVSDKESQQG